VFGVLDWFGAPNGMSFDHTPCRWTAAAVRLFVTTLAVDSETRARLETMTIWPILRQIREELWREASDELWKRGDVSTDVDPEDPRFVNECAQHVEALYDEHVADLFER
jgi:hypothetical protein